MESGVIGVSNSLADILSLTQYFLHFFCGASCAWKHGLGIHTNKCGLEIVIFHVMWIATYCMLPRILNLIIIYIQVNTCKELKNLMYYGIAFVLLYIPQFVHRLHNLSGKRYFGLAAAHTISHSIFGKLGNVLSEQ